MDKIFTKFGSAIINEGGYYRIRSTKEGNRNKFLHRLVWEDWYGVSVPDGYVIHHIDGNRLNNEIWNLQCVQNNIHNKHHMLKNNPWKDKNLSEEHKNKIKKSMMGKNCRNDLKDKDILRLLEENYTQAKISEILKIPLRTIEYRIKGMRDRGVL